MCSFIETSIAPQLPLLSNTSAPTTSGDSDQWTAAEEGVITAAESAHAAKQAANLLTPASHQAAARKAAADTA